MIKKETEELYKLMLPILRQMNNRIKLIIEQNKETLKIIDRIIIKGDKKLD